MVNVLIYDDESNWLKFNSALVKEYFDEKKIKVNIISFTKVPGELPQADIALLDIDAHGEPVGLELAKQLKSRNRNTIIIFITAHDEYTLESYSKEINSFGYLVKPIEPSYLYDKLTQSLIYLNGLVVSRSNYIKFGKENISEKCIISIEVNRRKLIVYTTQGVVESSYTPLIKLLDTLSNSFLIINRSILINMRYITSYNREGVCLKDNKIYTLPAKRASEIIKQIDEFYEKGKLL